MANQVLMTISRDERERERLMQEERILLDYYSGINYEKKKSLAEGRAEGIQMGTEKGIQIGVEKERKEMRDMLNNVNSLKELEELKQFLRG